MAALRVKGQGGEGRTRPSKERRYVHEPLQKVDTDSEDHFVAVSANGYEVWVMKRSATESDEGAQTFGKIEVCEQPCHGSMKVFSALTPPTMTIDAGWSKAGSSARAEMRDQSLYKRGIYGQLLVARGVETNKMRL